MVQRFESPPSFNSLKYFKPIAHFRIDENKKTTLEITKQFGWQKQINMIGKIQGYIQRRLGIYQGS